MRLKVLIIISLFFLFIHCEKETPVDSGVKMNSLYPEYDWQPLLIPQGIESSTDSMAQVIHGYFKLANSLEDYTRWCYFPPSDFEYMNEHIKRIPKEGFNTWEVSFDRWGIEIYKEPVNVQLKVSETESEYYWESYINARVQDPVIGLKVFDDVLYIESGASKDFKTGYMMRRFIWDERALNCVWEWEISDINETYNMSVVLNDLSKVKLD